MKEMTPEKFAKLALTVCKIGDTRWSPFKLGPSGRLVTTWCFGHSEQIGSKMAPKRSRTVRIETAFTYYCDNRKKVNAEAKRLLQEGIFAQGVKVIN